MEPRNHQSFAKKIRKNYKRQQKHQAHVSRHRRKFSWRIKKQAPAKHLTFNRYLRKALLKLYRRGYNLLESPVKSVPRCKSGPLDGGQILSYFKHYHVKMCYGEMLMACLLLFLLYRQSQIQNTDLRIQMAAFLILLLLVKLFVCDRHLIQWLRQMMDMVLTSVVTTLSPRRRSAGEVFRTAFQAGVSCRQQYVQGTRSEHTKLCRCQLWLSTMIWRMGRIVADGQAHNHWIRQSQPDKKKDRKEKIEHLTRIFFALDDICRIKIMRKYNRNFMVPEVSQISTFPLDDDLSGYFKCLESQPPPDEHELLKFEWKRILTFDKCIQHISAVRLAKNGFYFAGNAQNPCLTRCYSCGLENDKWEYFSNMEEFHRTHSPHCRHLASTHLVSLPNMPPLPSTTATASGERGNDRGACGVSTLASVTGAIQITSGQSGPLAAAGIGTTTSRTVTPASAAVSLPPPHTATSVTGASAIPQVSLISTPPTVRSSTGQQNSSGASHMVGGGGEQVVRHPEYHSLENRLGSFTTWLYQIDPSPRKMAEAGFFYTGHEDMVKCFYCGIACCEWNDGESAWTEHAIGNMECPFLKLMKDSVFFDRARREKSLRERERRQLRPVAKISVPEQDVDPMVTNTAKLLMEMNISPLLVKQAVQFVWREKGGFFEDNEMALNWCLDEMEKEKNSSLISRGGVEKQTYVSTIANPIDTSRASGTMLYTSSTSTVTLVSTLLSSSNAQEANTTTETPSGSSEVDQVTVPKHLQESVSTGPSASIVETVATTSSSSIVSAPAAPIYTTAGQSDDRGSKKEDAKITDVMKILFDMGFTYSSVKEELPWIEHLTDSAVEDIVEMAVIRFTGKMERTNAEAKKSSIEAKHVTNSASACSEPVISSTVVASSCPKTQTSLSPSTTQSSNTATVPVEGTQHLSTEIPRHQNANEVEINHLSTTDKSLPMTKVVSVCLSTCNSNTIAICSTSDILTCAVTQTESASSISVTQSDIISLPVFAAQPSAGSSPVLMTQSYFSSPPASATIVPCAGMTCAGMTVSAVGLPLLMSTALSASEASCDTAAGNNCKPQPTGQVENPTGGNDQEDDQSSATAELEKSSESTANVAVEYRATGEPPHDKAHKTHRSKKKKPKEKANLPEKPETPIDAEALGEIMMQVMEMKKCQENLKEKTDSLQEEKEKLKDRVMCKICMDKEVAMVFLPCGHFVACEQCSSSIKVCPICRQKIKDKKKTYAS